MSDKAYRARNLRYKKAALASLGYDSITDELYDIASECSDVQYFVDSDRETLLNALDGDDEAEYEFRMAFIDLSTQAEQLQDAVLDTSVREYFDDCTVALIGNRYRTIGYDAFEEDYYGLTSFERELAHTESGKRLMRHTKQEIISIVGQCLGIVLAFYDLRQKYDYLKAVFDILRDENTAVLQVIKGIEQAYAEAAADGFRGQATKSLDRLVAGLPDQFWLE